MSITTTSGQCRCFFTAVDVFGRCPRCAPTLDRSFFLAIDRIERFPRFDPANPWRWFDRFREPIDATVRLLAAPAISRITRARAIGNALHAMRWKRRRFVQKLVSS